MLSIYRVLPGFRGFAVFEKIKRFFILFLDGRYREGVRALARAQIVNRVLSIYRVLPGFREFAVFEKIKRFFILFLDGRYREGVRALARAQIVYRVLSIYRVLPGFREFAVFENIKRFFIFFLDGRYREGSGPLPGPESGTKPQGLCASFSHRRPHFNSYRQILRYSVLLGIHEKI